MAITEEARHRLYRRLEETLGSAEAATLMDYLPPVGWADVATKRDLDHLADRMRAELQTDLRGIEASLRGWAFGIIGIQTTITTILFAAVRLL